MDFRTLISSEQLAACLGDASVVIVDCRFKLDEPQWGAGVYTIQHIPGARYFSLDTDLSGTKTGSNGRHPLPDPRTLAGTFGRAGIATGMQVVAYDQDSGIFASRLWWLLRWLGHETVAVLDGGFRRWVAEGHPTRSGVEHAAPRVFRGAPRLEMTASVEEVASRIGRSDWRLIDARAPERYLGKTEPLDRVAGHIPTAVDHFFMRNLDQNGRFRPADELRADFASILGATPPEHVIAYCGSGVTACHNLLAFEHAGLTGAKLYPGSWSEWSSDPTRPVETDSPSAR